MGARFENVGRSYAGAAYVFRRDQGGPGDWGEVKKLTAPDAETDDAFGILGASDRAAPLEQGGAPLRYFPKSPIKKDYAVIPESIRSDDVALALWINASVEFCETLPAPRRRTAT